MLSGMDSGGKDRLQTRRGCPSTRSSTPSHVITRDIDIHFQSSSHFKSMAVWMDHFLKSSCIGRINRKVGIESAHTPPERLKNFEIRNLHFVLYLLEVCGYIKGRLGGYGSPLSVSLSEIQFQVSIYSSSHHLSWLGLGILVIIFLLG